MRYNKTKHRHLPILNSILINISLPPTLVGKHFDLTVKIVFFLFIFMKICTFRFFKNLRKRNFVFRKKNIFCLHCVQFIYKSVHTQIVAAHRSIGTEYRFLMA